MRISDWSSDVCSSDLVEVDPEVERQVGDGDLAGLGVGKRVVAGGSGHGGFRGRRGRGVGCVALATGQGDGETEGKQESAHGHPGEWTGSDRKSTRLNSSH